MKRVSLPLYLAGQLIEFECFVVPNLINSLFFGAEFLNHFRATIDYGRQCMTFMCNEKLISVPFLTPVVNAVALENNLNDYLKQMKINEDERLELKVLVDKYSTLFRDKPGLTQLYSHKIEMLDDTPFREHSSPVPFALRPLVEVELNRMTKLGIIKREATSYCSPMTVVKKKDNTVRICLDARRLNKAMSGDCEAPQPVEELLQKFEGIKCMSLLDLRSSYWQIPLSKESQKYTGFSYNNRTFVYKVLPFGLKTAVGSFTRAMDQILGSSLQDFVTIYVDDILITSCSFTEHCKHLDLVFRRLAQANLTINIQKSLFFSSRT